jgi:hypothetical protein
MQAQREVEEEILPIHNLALNGCGWSALRYGSFTHEKDPVRIVEEIVCACADMDSTEYLTLTSI